MTTRVGDSLGRGLLPVYAAQVGGWDVTHRLEALTWEENEGELAARASAVVALDPHGQGYIENIVHAGDTIRVYADAGSGMVERVVGRIFRRGYVDERKTLLQITGYDAAVYLAKSEDNFSFMDKPGITARAMVHRVLAQWGMTPSRNDTPDVVIGKTVWEGETVGKVLEEIFDLVMLQTGQQMVARATGNAIEIVTLGSNAVKYRFDGANCESVRDEEDIEDLITQVVVIGQNPEATARSVLEPLPGRIEGSAEMRARYGTLQKIVKGPPVGTQYPQVLTAGQQLLLQRGQPKRLQRIITMDRPDVRKGDRHQFSVGTMDGDFYVSAVHHDAASGLMTIEVDTSGRFGRRAMAKVPQIRPPDISDVNPFPGGAGEQPPTGPQVPGMPTSPAGIR